MNTKKQVGTRKVDFNPEMQHGWLGVGSGAGAVLLLLLLLSCWSQCFAQNLILNGSFETGPSPGTVRLNPGSTEIIGWSVTRARIDYVTSGWQASEGARLIDLDGNDGDAGGMAQTFSSVPGASYTVKFDLAGNPGHRSGNDYPRVKYMRVAAAGQSADFSFDTTGHDFLSMGWTAKTWQFTANSTSTTLEFYSLDAPAGAGDGPALDNVVVMAPTDLVTNSLSWDNSSGGANFQYAVNNGPLATATTAKLFWSSGTTTAAIVPGAPEIFTQPIPVGASGLSAVIPVPAANFANPPATATHVLLALDYDPANPNGLVQESDEGNNVQSLPIYDISAQLLEFDAQTSAFLYGYHVARNNLTHPLAVALYWAPDLSLTFSSMTLAYSDSLIDPADLAVGDHIKGVLLSAMSSMPANANYLIAIVNSDLGIPELNYTDDWRASLLGCSTSPLTAEQLMDYLRHHALKGGAHASDFGGSYDAQQPGQLTDYAQGLANMQKLIDESLAAGWDPRLILGIAGAETTFGRANPPAPFNYWGLTDGQENFLSFGSWNAAVREAATRLSQPAYQGKKTIGELGPLYTATAVEDWINTVSGVMAPLGYPAGRTREVTCQAGAIWPYKTGSGSVGVKSPVSLYLVDPLGRRLGALGTSGTFYQEISGAVAEVVAGQLKSIWLPDLIDGKYRLFLTGTGTGTYELDVTFIDTTGRLSGIIANGQISDRQTSFLVVNCSTNDANATVFSPLVPARVNIVTVADKVRLVWPSDLLGAALQESSNLSSWIPVTNSPTPVGSSLQIELPLVPDQRFYRLLLQ